MAVIRPPCRAKKKGQPEMLDDRQADPGVQREGHAEECAPQHHRDIARLAAGDLSDQRGRSDDDGEVRDPLDKPGGQHCVKSGKARLKDRQRAAQTQPANEQFQRPDAPDDGTGHSTQNRAQKTDDRQQPTHTLCMIGVKQHKFGKRHGNLGKIAWPRPDRASQRRRT